MHIQPRDRFRRSQHHRQLQFCVPSVSADDATYRDRAHATSRALQGNLTSIRQRRLEELSGCTWKVAVGLEVTSIPKQAVKLSAELRMLDASCNECLSAWKPMCHRRCAALIEGAAGGAGTLDRDRGATSGRERHRPG